MDLTRVDCVGCVHRGMLSGSPEAICKRSPPVFRPPMPVRTEDGREGILPGAWTFPPAALKCGEFKRSE